MTRSEYSGGLPKAEIYFLTFFYFLLFFNLRSCEVKTGVVFLVN